MGPILMRFSPIRKHKHHLEDKVAEGFGWAACSMRVSSVVSPTVVILTERPLADRRREVFPSAFPSALHEIVNAVRIRPLPALRRRA